MCCTCQISQLTTAAHSSTQCHAAEESTHILSTQQHKVSCSVFWRMQVQMQSQHTWLGTIQMLSYSNAVICWSCHKTSIWQHLNIYLVCSNCVLHTLPADEQFTTPYMKGTLCCTLDQHINYVPWNQHIKLTHETTIWNAHKVSTFNTWDLHIEFAHGMNTWNLHKAEHMELMPFGHWINEEVLNQPELHLHSCYWCLEDMLRTQLHPAVPGWPMPWASSLGAKRVGEGSLVLPVIALVLMALDAPASLLCLVALPIFGPCSSSCMSWSIHIQWTLREQVFLWSYLMQSCSCHPINL